MSSTAPPPRLRRVVIQGFRAIDHLDLALPEGDDDRAAALVLAGENGCGKTSVLEAILLLLGRVDLMPTDTAPVRELVRQGSTDFKIEGVVEGGGGWSVDAAMIERLELAFRPPGHVGTSFGVPVGPDALAAALHSTHVRWNGSFPLAQATEFVSARREPQDLGEPVADARGRRSAREERRLSELKRRLANVYARSKHNVTFERVERYMRPFFGPRWSLDVVFRDARVGSEPIVVVRDGPAPVGDDGEALTWEAIRERSARGEAMPRVVPIDRLSSGQMAVLAMAYPFVFGDRPVALALLDEPEQHLHPTWQRAFLRALRALSPTTTFITATHSAQVLDSVAPHERLALVPLREPPVADAAE